MNDALKVAVIGAGTMGNGIAHVFAQFGHSVTLIDVEQARLDSALKTIGGNIDRQVKKGALAETDKTAIMARLEPATSLDAAAGARLIIEAATEQLPLKLELFRKLDALAPDAARRND